MEGVGVGGCSGSCVFLGGEAQQFLVPPPTLACPTLWRPSLGLVTVGVQVGSNSGFLHDGMGLGRHT